MKDDDLCDAVLADWRQADLSAKRQAMLNYAEKLTSTPGNVDKTDVETLRNHGFSDEDILHIVEVASYFAYVNRIADGLGVQLESK